jgi:ribosome-associated toxin RatA of RatAB toxin-antitoxin module
MASTTGTVVVNAAAARIVEVIADLEQYPTWADGVDAVEVLAHDGAGRPQRARFEVSSAFVKGWYIVDYTWSPDAVSWTLVESPLLKQLDGSYRWTPTDGSSTSVTYDLTAVPSMPVIGPLRRKAEQQLVDIALRSLARRVTEAAA